MNGKQSLTSRFNILSQNVQGLTPEKEDILLELMDQLQLDLVFIQETFRQPSQSSDTRSVQFMSRAGYPILEYVNPNQRRGIQFRVASYLEPAILQSFCQKSEILEILAIQFQKTIFLGTYIADGRSPEGIKQRVEIMDSLEAKFPNSAIIFLADLNCRATALGNLQTNESIPFLEAWIRQSDSWDFHKFQEPTLPSSEGFLDIVFYKDLVKCHQVSFEDTIP
jgi:exonuclease III